MQPLVSIIIPTYNRAHLLGETLDSVLAQTYTYWECFIVDDGSTDNTEQFVRSYCERDKRFQFYKRPENRPKGANACRNYGFELSKGEYMNWFDDDDIMVKDKIMKQTKQLLDSDLNFTVCQTLIFKGDLSNVLGLRKGKLKSDNFFNDFITNKIKWLTQAPLLKRKYLIDNDLSFD
jgi:glycosyltransferase involved in cell wall biosynthesis